MQNTTPPLRRGQAHEGSKSRTAKTLGACPPPYNTDQKQKQLLDPRVVVSFFLTLVFLPFSTFDLIYRHIRVML